MVGLSYHQDLSLWLSCGVWGVGMVCMSYHHVLHIGFQPFARAVITIHMPDLFAPHGGLSRV